MSENRPTIVATATRRVQVGEAEYDTVTDTFVIDPDLPVGQLMAKLARKWDSNSWMPEITAAVTLRYAKRA